MKRTTMLAMIVALAAAAAGACSEGGGSSGAGEVLAPETLAPGSGPRLAVGPTASVTVACPAKMDRGTSGSCIAFGYDAAGFLASQSATWSTSTSTLVSVSGSTVTASAGNTGTASVTATINGHSATANITIANSVTPPSVTISGPGSIRPNTQCTWSASITGGTAPLSYSWSRSPGSDTSTASDFSTQSASSFTIYLTVTDANGLIDTEAKTIIVSSGAAACPP